MLSVIALNGTMQSVVATSDPGTSNGRVERMKKYFHSEIFVFDTPPLLVPGFEGATTLSIMAFSTMTLSIKG
jgi:hypothetical protein